MNRFTRMLTMAGIGLMASVTMGAAPAVAVDSTDAGSARGESSARPWWGNDRLVGFFRSYRACDDAGETGEDEGWWEDYDCVRVRSGLHNRRFALLVEQDDWGHGWSGSWNGRWHGQWWPGQGGNWNPRPHRPWFPRPHHPRPWPFPHPQPTPTPTVTLTTPPVTPAGLPIGL
jgi:hypothetical protein